MDASYQQRVAISSCIMDNVIKCSYMKLRILSLLTIFAFTPLIAGAASNQHAGRIYLQVESHGEAWYVNPNNLRRYYLGRPADAFNIMRSLGLGITNADIAKIPVAVEGLTGLDSDGDGLPNVMEEGLGTDIFTQDTDGDGFTDFIEVQSGFNPLDSRKMLFDSQLIEWLKGKILIQVESLGQAWYVNPENGKRYFLGRPEDAFNVMRSVGIGITNNNLSTITEYAPTQGEPVQVTACGEALLTETAKEDGDITKRLGERQQFKSVYDCLKQHYEACQPATGTLREAFSINHYQIVGKKNSSCEVKVTYRESIDSRMNGQTMICQMNMSRSMFVEVGNFPVCEGGPAEYVPEESLVGWRIVDSSDIFSYSDEEIVWTISSTTASNFSQTSAGTVSTINDEGFFSSLGAKGEF